MSTSLALEPAEAAVDEDERELFERGILRNTKRFSAVFERIYLKVKSPRGVRKFTCLETLAVQP